MSSPELALSTWRGETDTPKVEDFEVYAGSPGMNAEDPLDRLSGEKLSEEPFELSEEETEPALSPE